MVYGMFLFHKMLLCLTGKPTIFQLLTKIPQTRCTRMKCVYTVRVYAQKMVFILFHSISMFNVQCSAHEYNVKRITVMRYLIHYVRFRTRYSRCISFLFQYIQNMNSILYACMVRTPHTMYVPTCLSKAAQAMSKTFSCALLL